MTNRTNAKVAGITFLAYIALGILAMILHGKAQAGDDTVTQLANVAEHMTYIKIAAVLDLLCGFAAITLGVTLFALTRVVDADVARLGLACRVAEGIVAGVSVQGSLGLAWLAGATESQGANAEAVNAIAAWVLAQDWSYLVAATFFSAGSTAFSWLFLRGRLIPVSLAWLGVIASVLLVVALPLQLAGFVAPSVVRFLWAPMAVFEIVLSVWLIAKGVAFPASSQS